MRQLSSGQVQVFRRRVYRYFKDHGRSFPWRNTTDPYCIFVSEVMLQQTQADRVVPYYTHFLTQFPDINTLAHASNRDVLNAWKGLGYNRRGLFLKRAAEHIVAEYNGEIPSDEEALISLPGVGSYTAAAIQVFAFNKPAIVIETNIRSVFLHTFFSGKRGIPDAEITPLIDVTCDKRNPRKWFSALMDYGAHIKQSGNPNEASKHYTKQMPFKGSRREVRGKVIALLLEHEQLETQKLKNFLKKTPDRIITEVLADLEKEGFLKTSNGRVAISE